MSCRDKKGYVKEPVNLHNDPFVDEINSLFESLHEHDDRGLVLSIAAFAEDTLGLLLLSYLREPRTATELVEGFNAPFGTFSARIKGALVLGLIRKDQYRSLELIRRIRNKFAHNWTGVSLDRDDIADTIRQLPPPPIETNELSPCKLPLRKLLTDRATYLLIQIRMLAKQLDKTEKRLPLIMGDGKPVFMESREVD